ncbi:hypothetical protein AB2S62_17815 [Vibrio sp. NTOU-M3]|uniref:hypothetical protein n=1 Tax=Vibrio sp. NTOU-M3 TaxID=3234954 RepID=UPI00349F7FB5
MNSQRSLLAVAIALGLAACGSDSTDTGNSGTDTSTTTTSLTAKAADGYLVGANACLDLNDNKVCDDDEPNATTGDDGEFTIDGLTQEQIDQGVLLIEVVAGQTIDTDNPDVVLNKSYKLTAPPGSSFISPLTTLVQNEVEKGSTLEEAKTAIQAKLGTTLDLTQDYIEAKNSDQFDAAEQAEYANLHRVAQVTASVMADNTDALTQAAAGAGITVEALTSLIVEEVTRVLEDVVANIDAAGDSFDPSAIASDINRDHIGLDESNLADKVNENEANKQAVVTDLGELVKGDGLNWFGGADVADQDLRLEYGTLKLEADDSVSDVEHHYDYVAEQFYPSKPQPINTNQMVLGEGGWVAENDTIVSIKVNDDASIELEMATPVLNERASAKQVDVSGLNVGSIMNKTADEGVWGQVMPTALTFPDNAVAYKLSVQSVNDGFYSFNKGDWCIASNPDRYAALNNMCNGISAFKEGTDTWLATLADTVAQDESDRDGATNNADLIPMAGMSNGDIFAQLLADGTVVYYKRSWDWSAPFTKFADAGSWEDITVNGQQLRKVTLPTSVKAQATWSNYGADNATYLAVVDGFVRITWHVAAERGSEEYIFDAATKQFILDNFVKPEPATPLNLQACLDSLPDAGYQAAVGDVTVYDVQRAVPWANDGLPQSFSYEFEFQGSTFSWLDDVTLVTGLPSWITDMQGTLEKTRVTMKDSVGDVIGHENAYSSADHYLGQEGFNPDGSFGWGTAKAVLPLAIADAEKLLNVPALFGSATNMPLASEFDYSVYPALEIRPGVRTVTVETPLTDMTDIWSLAVFDYQETYLGKEEVTVGAGTIEACKVSSETYYPEILTTDTKVSWLTNRGFVKEERDEPSWGATIMMEAASLPASIR